MMWQCRTCDLYEIFLNTNLQIYFYIGLFLAASLHFIRFLCLVLRISVMAAKEEGVPLEVEQLGDFLLTTERLYDCFFVVGNVNQAPTEKIGAVKACLMNQSQVFRSMLHDSRLAETGDIIVPDIQPNVFRLLLKHCYGGLESCKSLDSEITVQLCYAAEKYMVTSLKRKIAEKLKPDHVSDVFRALQCCVNYNVTDLQQYVTEMVCEQTDKVFESDGFLDIDVESLVFIVKQEVLNCSELDIWRAALKWAAHKAQSEDGPAVRQWLTQPLKHIRLMTLSHEALCSEVLPTNVLSFKEFCETCARSSPDSATICTLTEPRKVYQERWKWWETVVVSHDKPDKRWCESDESYSCVRVGARPIMLESITCVGSIAGDFCDCYGLAYPCKAELAVARVTDYISSTCEDSVIIKFEGSANRYEQFTIPTLVNGDPITLQADSTYKLKLTFTSPHPSWRQPACSSGHVFPHGKFHCSYIYEDGIGWKPSHIVKFQYSYKR